MPTQAKFPCPKCGRTLIQSGVLEIDLPDQYPHSLPTFQCDECLTTVDFAGERIEVALTFVVGADGRAFDPAEPERDLTK